MNCVVVAARISAYFGAYVPKRPESTAFRSAGKDACITSIDAAERCSPQLSRSQPLYPRRLRPLSLRTVRWKHSQGDVRPSVPGRPGRTAVAYAVQIPWENDAYRSVGSQAQALQLVRASRAGC